MVVHGVCDRVVCGRGGVCSEGDVNSLTGAPLRLRLWSLSGYYGIGYWDCSRWCEEGLDEAEDGRRRLMRQRKLVRWW
ncbi:hypothetical protein V6N11_035529 [Hibiscus sabdariffa]|uniref:Uncharacterized protein n=2 Tax=Hibiscus sabdariffa TaxID=183260 RepID=A0ABR2R0N3_9ROSI